jgi:plasmid stabilization system protein ParE
MSHSVVFAPEVSDQLEALFLYVAERSSPAIAERFTGAVVTTCEGLALFPLRGVAREDIRPGLRLTHHKGRTVIAYAAPVIIGVRSIPSPTSPGIGSQIKNPTPSAPTLTNHVPALAAAQYAHHVRWSGMSPTIRQRPTQ